MRKRQYHIAGKPGHILLGVNTVLMCQLFEGGLRYIFRPGHGMMFNVVGVFDSYEAACDAVREIEWANDLANQWSGSGVVGPCR